MGLFGNTAEKPSEKKPLFGGKKEDEKQVEMGSKSPALFGGTTGGEPASGGQQFDKPSSGGGSGQPAGSGGESAGSGGESAGSKRGNFKLEVATGELDGNDGKPSSGISGSGNDDSGNDSENGTAGEESTSTQKRGGRPTWLSAASGEEQPEKKAEEKPKDIRMEKRVGRPPKNGAFLSDDQVEILLCGIFDGVALFRGEHWKLSKQELGVIPSLARILNRIVDSLPKNVSKHAFNIMDYVIVIGAVGAIVMKRVNYEKEGGRNHVREESERTGGGSAARAAADGIQNGSQKQLGDTGKKDNESGISDKGVQVGISTIASPPDLAGSITPFR